jgi:predicted nucleotidyltransferase
MTETLHNNNVFQHPRYVEGSAENTESLERFSDGLRELQSDNPEIVGATLFGSRLKGEATTKSDIDCTVLVDADALNVHDIHIDVGETGSLDWGEHSDLKHDFEAHFGKVLADKTDKAAGILTKGIYVQPISESLIQTQLNKYLTYLDKVDQYRAEKEQWWDSNSDAKPPELPETAVITGGIPPLFAPDLIDGLSDYRKTVINMLSQAGSHGEEAWQTILQGVEFGEGHKSIEDPSAYPTSLEQARQWYGVDNHTITV